MKPIRPIGLGLRVLLDLSQKINKVDYIILISRKSPLGGGIYSLASKNFGSNFSRN